MLPTQSATTARTRAIPAVMAVAALGLGGCAIWESSPPMAPPASAPASAVANTPTSLSGEASAALETARLRVADARRSRTLWKSAAEKLVAAEAAAARKDSRDTVKLSNEIVALCELSTAQALRPPVVW